MTMIEINQQFTNILVLAFIEEATQELEELMELEELTGIKGREVFGENLRNCRNLHVFETNNFYILSLNHIDIAVIYKPTNTLFDGSGICCVDNVNLAIRYFVYDYGINHMVYKSETARMI